MRTLPLLPPARPAHMAVHPHKPILVVACQGPDGLWELRCMHAVTGELCNTIENVKTDCISYSLSSKAKSSSLVKLKYAVRHALCTLLAGKQRTQLLSRRWYRSCRNGTQL